MRCKGPSLLIREHRLEWEVGILRLANWGNIDIERSAWWGGGVVNWTRFGIRPTFDMRSGYCRGSGHKIWS